MHKSKTIKVNYKGARRKRKQQHVSNANLIIAVFVNFCHRCFETFSADLSAKRKLVEIPAWWTNSVIQLAMLENELPFN